MLLRVKGRIINLAYAVLIKCAKTVARTNDVDIETALSLISLVRPEIWTRKDSKRIAGKLTDARDFYFQSKRMSPALVFFKDCTTPRNRMYTKLIDCACVEEKTKKLFGLSALDLYYIRKLLGRPGIDLADTS